MARDPVSQYLSLIQGLQFKDARTKEALQLMGDIIAPIYRQLFPPSTTSSTTPSSTATVSDVTGLVSEIFPTNLRLIWDSQGAGVSYEVRLGSDWDTANHLVTTGSPNVNLDPISIPLSVGNYTFLVKALDEAGTYSTNATSILVNIPPITPPTITAKLISNFVLLTWTEGGSVFQIDHYHLLRNGVEIGTALKGNFHAFFETVGGNNSYQVISHDIADNESSPSTAVQLLVGNPIDFILEDSITSILDGTITNGIVENSQLLVPIFDAQTYEDHFIDNVWDTSQEQIDAGYPIYIQPAESTAEYQETFDFGALFTNVIINIDWNFIAVSGNVTVSTDIEYSTDAITWSTPVTGTSVFADSARYVRVTVTFTPDDDTCLLRFYNFRCLLNVQRQNDGGFGTADSTDVGGTAITFNKTFLSVDSITITPVGSVVITPVYDYTFTPRDNTFYVYLFDNTSTRVSGDFTWAARGIISE